MVSMMEISVKKETEDGDLYELKSEENTFRGYFDEEKFYMVEYILGDRSSFVSDLREIFELEDHEVSSIDLMFKVRESKSLLPDYNEEWKDIDGRETLVLNITDEFVSVKD